MAEKNKINRKKKNPEYKSFKLRKRIKPAKFKPVPSAWSLWKESLSFIKQHWKKITIFLLVYMSLYIVFVRGLGSAIDFNNIKESISENGESVNGLIRSFIFFSVLVSTSNAVSSDVAAAYQSILFVIGSLAFIWLIRSLHAKNNKDIRVKDSFYRGMHPLIPFIAVLIILGLETIPLSISAYFLNAALATPGVTFVETVIFVFLSALISMISLYLLSGTWPAIYIVTLAGAEPWKSIKAANKLISVSRWYVMRRLFGLVFLLFITAVVLVIPLLLVLPEGYEYIAEAGFFLYLLISFSLAHISLYKLYKSML